MAEKPTADRPSVSCYSDCKPAFRSRKHVD